MAALDGTVDMLQLVLSSYPDISVQVLDKGLSYLKTAPERAYRESFQQVMRGEAEYDERLARYRARVQEIEKIVKLLRGKRREQGGLSGGVPTAVNNAGVAGEADHISDADDASDSGDFSDGTV